MHTTDATTASAGGYVTEMRVLLVALPLVLIAAALLFGRPEFVNLCQMKPTTQPPPTQNHLTDPLESWNPE